MIIEIFGGYALFASAISLNKLILAWLSPAFFVGIRRTLAGLILFGYKAWKSPRLKLSYIKSDIITITIISIMTMCVPSILKAYSFKYLVSSKAALIGNLDPFITALYAYFLWNEKLSYKSIIGMIIACSGITYIIAGSSTIESTLQAWWIFSLPEIAMVASLAIGRLGWILAKKVLKSERYTPSELNSLNMIISGIVALFGSYWYGTCEFCSMPYNNSFILLFLYSVFMGDIVCYNMYGYLLKKYNITLLSLCGLSIPFFIHILGPIIHNEPITLNFFIAFGFVVLGTSIFYKETLNNREKK